MAAARKHRDGELLVLVCDLRHAGRLYPEGTLLLPDDEVVKARGDCFASFGRGLRERERIREEVDRASQREEAALRAAAAPPPPPAKPHRVVSTRRPFNPGVGEVAAGSILRASDQLVQENPGAFTSIED